MPGAWRSRFALASDRQGRPTLRHPSNRPSLAAGHPGNGRNPLRVFIFFPKLAGVLLPARLTLYKFAFRARDPDDRGGSEKNGVVTSIPVAQLLKLIKVLSAHRIASVFIIKML